MMEISGKMRKVEVLPTRDCEASYAPADSESPYRIGNTSVNTSLCKNPLPN